MSELPFMARLLIAISPKVTLHISNDFKTDVKLSKIINVGKDKIERQLRKAERKRNGGQS